MVATGCSPLHLTSSVASLPWSILLLTVISLFSLSLLSLCVIAQPFDVSSYPVPFGSVPVPGILLAADAPLPPTSSSSSAPTSTSTSTSAVVSVSTTSVATCTSNWSCTATGQWLPLNINLVLFAASVLFMVTVLRKDRKILVILLSWAAAMSLLLFVNNVILWYLSMGIVLLVFHVAMTWEGKTSKDVDEEDSDDEDENGKKEGENENSQSNSMPSLSFRQRFSHTESANHGKSKLEPK